jgi:MazG family protein
VKTREPDIRPLYEIMARLRAEQGGCPWDLEQTHESLRPYLIEEAYEVLEALDKRRPQALCEELGDLLLQIVFHARLAEEDGEFDLGDVIGGISDKMVRRHPHVFGGDEARDAQAVRDRWEQIKVGEGRSLFGGTPRTLPALLRAQRIGEKAAGVGFDWPSLPPVLEKVREELAELEHEIAVSPAEGLGDPRGRVFAELGDLLFSLTNLARHLGQVAEDALREATERFEERFEEVRRQAGAEGRALEACSLEELDAYWEEAKRLVAGASADGEDSGS